MAFDGCEQNMWREFKEHPNVVMRSAPLAKSTQLLASMMRTSNNINSVMSSSRIAPSGGGAGGMYNSAATANNDVANRRSPTFPQRNTTFLHSNESPPTSPVPQHANPFINRMNIHSSLPEQQLGSSPLNTSSNIMPPQWNKISLLNNSPLNSAALITSTTGVTSRSSMPAGAAKAAEAAQNMFSPFQMLSTYQRQPYTNVHSGTMSPSSITTNANPFVSSSPTFQFPPSFAVSPNNNSNSRSSPMSVSPTLQHAEDASRGTPFDRNNNNNFSPITARLKRPLRHSPLTTTLKNHQPQSNANNFAHSNGHTQPFGSSLSSASLQQQLLLRQQSLADAAGAGISNPPKFGGPSRFSVFGTMGGANGSTDSSSVTSSAIGSPLANSTPLGGGAQNVSFGSNVGDRSLLNYQL